LNIQFAAFAKIEGYPTEIKRGDTKRAQDRVMTGKEPGRVSEVRIIPGVLITF